jgi:hypothetical protein
VLEAFAPRLLELRIGAHLNELGDDVQRVRLMALGAVLPNMSLSGLTAHPDLVRSRSPTLADVNKHIVTTSLGPLGTLTLLRCDDDSPQPPPTAFLTLLQLDDTQPIDIAREAALYRQPLQFLAAFTSQLRELHLRLSFNEEGQVVPVAALPPHLTALFCTDTFLQLPAGPARGWSTQAAAATAVGLSRRGVVWEGLPQLQTLEVEYGLLESAVFVGGALPDLLQGTPNLKRLACPAEFRPGCPQDAARLRGCAQMLTHLTLDPRYRYFNGAEDAAAEAEQLCEWVGSLRHLRQLHLWGGDIPPALFAQVSCLVPPMCVWCLQARSSSSSSSRECLQLGQFSV